MGKERWANSREQCFFFRIKRTRGFQKGKLVQYLRLPKDLDSERGQGQHDCDMSRSRSRGQTDVAVSNQFSRNSML